MIRRRYRARYPDGSLSEPFVYDQVDRDALDAVVICAHCLEGETRWVYLRSALRPPLANRGEGRGPYSARPPLGGLWELPAGLVEARDQTPDGPRMTARRELYEELGFDAPLERFSPLGTVTFPAPGFVAEQHFYFEVEVDPAARARPALDGSPLEHGGVVIRVALEQALAMCRAGDIQDAKTELGLRRLAEKST